MFVFLLCWFCVCNISVMVILDCGPSGVPNGQWMKIPRPGKLTKLYFHVGANQ